MYKCVLHVQSCFLLTRVSTDFFAVLVAVLVSMFFFFLIKFKYINESFAFSPAKFIYYFVVLHNNSIFFN